MPEMRIHMGRWSMNWKAIYNQATGKTDVYIEDEKVGELELPSKQHFMDLKRRLR